MPKLKIKSTYYPDKKLSFNDISLNIHNQLNLIKGYVKKQKL